MYSDQFSDNEHTESFDSTHTGVPEDSEAEFKALEQDAGRDFVSLVCSSSENNPHIIDVTFLIGPIQMRPFFLETIFRALNSGTEPLDKASGIRECSGKW